MAIPLVDWLTLREPADATARSALLVGDIAAHLPSDRPLRILDLGSGTGSNVRYLSPRLPAPQSWLLVDRDEELLAEARRRMPEITLETRMVDLARIDDPGLFEQRDLVTASALLDLVSEQWLMALAAHCVRSRAAVFFALTYNGESRCEPAEPEDTLVRLLMNRHQHTDKGFGPSAGPDAAAAAVRIFSAAGYTVQRAITTWQLDSDCRALQQELVEGLAHAAREIAPDQTALIEGWLRRRLDHIARGRSRILVSHEDMAGWLR